MSEEIKEFKPDYQGQIDMFMREAMIKNFKVKVNDKAYMKRAVDELAEAFI